MRTIAIVTPNEAFGGILVSVLTRPGWRVRHFSSVRQLGLYAGIARVDVVVLDRELGEIAPGGSVLEGLDEVVDTPSRVIVTTRGVGGWSRALCRAEGIDEVLLKPFSPVHLAERVRAHIAALPRDGHPGSGASFSQERRRPTASGQWQQPVTAKIRPRAFEDPNVVVLADWRRLRGLEDARS